MQYSWTLWCAVRPCKSFISFHALSYHIDERVCSQATSSFPVLDHIPHRSSERPWHLIAFGIIRLLCLLGLTQVCHMVSLQYAVLQISQQLTPA